MEKPSMATGRALLTRSEREYLAGEHGDQRRYEAKSRVKSRIQTQLAEDMAFFEEQDLDELLEAAREVVCEETDD